ncbi:hypothetical protein GCM10011583_50030 [Streptomyces camponoticapitis]|uniref:Uncharacterized protein n=1 Tax=Streptomyces camponoticapitis TaxID=1616125 RepID=A0ABQ2EHJ4_9ACTN|nr:hypothetical protein GCM10011583_50030 [Streptomyces camponoticapitis]
MEFESSHQKDPRMLIERLNKLLREARHSRDRPSFLWEDLVEVSFFHRSLYVHRNWFKKFEWAS